MAVFPDKKNYGEYMNAFWIEPAKRDVMGYALQNIAAGTTVPQGTPLYCDDDAKTAYACKYAVVVAVANDKKTLTVESNLLAANDKVMISGAASPSLLTISSVADGTIVLSAANSTIKAGDVIVEAATIDSTVQPVYLPNRVSADKAEVDALDATINAAHQAVVLENVVNYPAEFINKTAFPGSKLLIGCPLIVFTKQ